MTDPDPLHGAIDALEQRLQRAMRSADTVALDALVADDLVFTTHLGQVFGKKDDLALHASGQLQLEQLDLDDRTVHLLGDDVAVVVVRAHLAGQYAGQAFAGVFRYTRVWARRDGRWQVVAGQASQVAGA